MLHSQYFEIESAIQVRIDEYRTKQVLTLAKGKNTEGN